MAIRRDKRKRFVELAEARVQKAAHLLRLIGNLANQSNYDYSAADAQKIFAALEGELKLLKAKFHASLNRRGKSGFTLN